MAGVKLSDIDKDPVFGPMLRGIKTIHAEGKHNVHVWVEGTKRFYSSHRRLVKLTVGLALAIIAGKYLYDLRKKAYVRKLTPKLIKTWTLYRRTEAEVLYRKGTDIVGVIEAMVGAPMDLKEYWVVRAVLEPSSGKYKVKKVVHIFKQNERNEALRMLNTYLQRHIHG